jgi:hypothetical protein
MTPRLIIRIFAITAGCLLATLSASAQLISIPVPNYSFDTYGPNGTPINAYSNQDDQYDLPSPHGYSPWPTGEIWAGWENTSNGGLQLYSVSTSGDLGTFNGANAVNENTYALLESLNPVTTIDNNATYTLTFALSPASLASANDVTIELLATSQATDTTYYTNSVYSPASFQSPYPLITTLAVLGSTTVPASALDLQSAGTFANYSTSFTTLLGANSTYIGDDLTLALVVNGDTLFDNAQLTELTVPEPSTYALMLGGLAFLGFLARRQLA